MPLYSRKASGYVTLWPYYDFGNEIAVALYASGIRVSPSIAKANGYAVRVETDTPDGAIRSSQLLKSQWLNNARIEAMDIARGRSFELYKAVARGNVTVWERLESLVVAKGPRLTSDGFVEISRDGLIKAKPNIRSATGIAEFASNLARTVTHDMSKMVKQPLKDYIDTLMGYYPGKRFEDLTSDELSQLWEAGKTVLVPGLQTGYGLAASEITQNIQLSIMDVANQNREFLRMNMMPRIANSFRQEDVEAIQQIGTQGGFWIRDSSGMISQSLDANARSIIEEGLRLGQGRDEIGKMLIDRMPEIWQKYNLHYARTVAANAVSRARSYSEVLSYDSVGIEYLELVAMLDERTTDICRVLDGTIVEVRDAIAHQKRIAAIQDPTDIVTEAPFMKEKFNKKTGNTDITLGKKTFATVTRSGFGRADDRGEFKKKMGTKTMVKSGVTMPPFHHHCRTMTTARVEMVQVPAGYDAKTVAEGATDDSPGNSTRQRPVTIEPTPKDGRAVASGQKAPFDPPIQRNVVPKKNARPPSSTRARTVQQQDERIGKAIREKEPGTYKLTSAKPTPGGSSVIYTAELKGGSRIRVMTKNSAGQKSIRESGFVRPKTSPAPKPRKHPIKNAGKPKASKRDIRESVDRTKRRMASITQAKIDSNSANMISRLEKDDAFSAMLRKRKMTASEFHRRVANGWQKTTKDGNEMMHYLQLAAKEEFGLPDGTVDGLRKSVVAKMKSRKGFDATLSAYRSYVRIQYEETQAFFKNRGTKSVTLFRNAGFNRASEFGVPKGIDLDGTLQQCLISTQPVGSYTIDNDLMAALAGSDNVTMMIKQEIPVERIMGIPDLGFGNSSRAEFAVIGGIDDYAEVLPWRRANGGGVDWIYEAILPEE